MAYETGWTPIVELQTGETVNNKLTNAFESIDNGFAGTESDINAVNVRVNSLETRVTALENASAAQYEFGQVQNLTIVEDTFQHVTSATVQSLNQGIFEYKVSTRFKYNNTSTSAVFRYALIRNDNSTPTWYEVWHEPKDATNDDILVLGFPVDEVGGDKIEFRLEARCEATGHQLDIEYADVIIDQKR